MPWPRPKLTTRRMMTAVAVVAVILGGVRWHRWAMARRLEYQFKALDHALIVAYYREWRGRVGCFGPVAPPSNLEPRKVVHHEAMLRK